MHLLLSCIVENIFGGMDTRTNSIWCVFFWEEGSGNYEIVE